MVQFRVPLPISKPTISKTMNKPPVLETERLRLRPLEERDADRIQEYCNDARVAEMTARMPHPYPNGVALEWIQNERSEGNSTFAIALKESDELIGVIGLNPAPEGLRAEIGFWIAVPHWGKGFCTEAGREVVRYAFEETPLQRVWAGHFEGNDASGRVQEKMGLKREGFSPWGHCRFGELKDHVIYGLIRPDWQEQVGTG